MEFRGRAGEGRRDVRRAHPGGTGRQVRGGRRAGYDRRGALPQGFGGVQVPVGTDAGQREKDAAAQFPAGVVEYAVYGQIGVAGFQPVARQNEISEAHLAI